MSVENVTTITSEVSALGQLGGTQANGGNRRDVLEIREPPVGAGNRVRDVVSWAWGQTLGWSSFRANERWNEAGGDSLKALRMWLKIEEALGAELPFETFDVSARPTEITAALEQALASAELGNRSKLARRGVRVVCLQKGRLPHSMPVYCVPTALGAVRTYFELAKLLGSDYAVYAIELAEHQESAPFSSLQELIASFSDNVVEQHCGAPICLVGYSFGGLLALELARQLTARGQPVALLAMIHSVPPAGSLPLLFRIRHFAENVGPWARTLGPWARRVLTRVLSSQHYRTSYREVAGQRVKQVMRTWRGRPVHEGADWYESLSEGQRRLVDSNVAMGRQYRFEGVYRGRIVLFRDRPSGERAHPLRPRDLEDYGWRGVTGASVHIVDIPGDHGSCVRQPHVIHLANALRGVLAPIASGESWK
jgi:thioesterase domain-containing protein